MIQEVGYMSGFYLKENETLIGKAMMAYKYSNSISREPTRGYLYVTDKRICYYESWSGYEYMNSCISEIEEYEIRKSLFIKFIHIYDVNGKRFIFSGMKSNDVCRWLDEAGVRRLY